MSATADAARRAHYGDFYDPRGDATGPVVTVVGNCQAESLRLLLDTPGTTAVRVPPVFELDADDLPHLTDLLARTTVLVAQPVRDDYRGLALGTAQLAALLPPGARTVVVPIVRYAGLHPFHVLHHPPATSGEDAQPPLVPYHDLRTVRAAVDPGPPVPLTVAAVRAVAAASVEELRRREAHTDVAVADVLARPRADDLRTVNHPGNRLLVELARRVAETAGLTAPVDPGRRLLDAVLAPVEPAVVEAWDLGEGALREAWRIDGTEVPAAEVERQHLEWYAAHPDVAGAIWTRFRPTARLLGLVA